MNAKSLVVVFLLAPTASGQTTLAWKLAKGQTFEAERVATQKQSVAVGGKTLKRSSESTWHVGLAVKDRKADDFIVQATLLKVAHKIEGAADADIIDAKMHEKMQGSAFTLTLTPAGTIKQMAGYEDFLKRLTAGDKARFQSLRVAFPESAVKDALADLFGPLPAKPVQPGDRWHREYVEPIPHFGALRCTAQYVYRGEKKDRARIDCAVQTKYEPGKNDAPGLFRIVKGSIDSDKAGGTITFDPAAGRLVRHERALRLRGKLTIDAMDQRQEIDFTSENRVAVRVK